MTTQTDTSHLEPIEMASRDEITALQLSRLKKTLQHAYDNVPHHKAAFDAKGVHPDDLKSLSDLSKFPFMMKEDLRENYPFGLFAVPQNEVVRLHASSGTTGKPIVVGYTQNDLNVWGDLIARCIRAAGGRKGDMLQNAYGYGMFTGGLGAHFGAERLGCCVIPISGGQTEKQVQNIIDFKPSIFMSTPSYALVVAEELARQGIKPEDNSLRIGIFGAEAWTEGMRQEIEKKLGIHALDIYGLTEVMGPGVASECVETKDGLTIWEDHFYPEIIDPVTGEVLPDGEEGELVFTSLTKEAFPVIRYRTRDLTRILPPTSRAFRRLDRFAGRSDDMMIVRGVNVFPTQIEEQILRDKHLSGNYQIELDKKGHMDTVAVRCELQNEYSHQLSDEKIDEIAKRLQHHIKTNVGISTHVSVLEYESIPRSQVGKARRVIDHRPK
ncbi:MAG: phenylacetate--CoA ligase [Neisseriaceae bacterium]|nr:phenylacetate--CoA ligase [Neisseriaceae bacterium]MBP6861160.1 phenylacetate--CoA ligase [Neisseriaceae bacterium]